MHDFLLLHFAHILIILYKNMKGYEVVCSGGGDLTAATYFLNVVGCMQYHALAKKVLL